MCAGVLGGESGGVAVDQDFPQSDHLDFGVAGPTLLTASLLLAFNDLGDNAHSSFRSGRFLA